MGEAKHKQRSIPCCCSHHAIAARLIRNAPEWFRSKSSTSRSGGKVSRALRVEPSDDMVDKAVTNFVREVLTADDYLNLQIKNDRCRPAVKGVYYF